MIVAIKKLCGRLWCLMAKGRDCLFCLVKGVPWHHSWTFWGLPFVHVAKGSVVRIGDHFVVGSCSACNSIGVFQPVVIRMNNPNAVLAIGHHVGVSGSSIAVSERVEIGNYVLIGSGCLITDSDAHPICADARRQGEKPKTRPVCIADNVFIGARSIILKGVTIGERSVIGAGSVVTADIPPGVIAAGNPCRVIRKI